MLRNEGARFSDWKSRRKLLDIACANDGLELSGFQC